MPALLDWPQELLRIVLANLDVPHLKNVRLTCKTLGALGATTLLPSVVVVFTKQSFERLHEISLHPIFSLHVREIIYQPDRLDYYSSQDVWERRIYDYAFVKTLSREALEELQAMPPDDPRKVYHGYSEERLNTGWEKYRALYKEQKKICQREMDKCELGVAIMHMPRLEGVTVKVVSEGNSYCLPSAHFARSYGEMLVRSSGENSLKDGEPPGYRHFLPLLVPFTLSDKYDIKGLLDEGSPIAETLNEEYRVSNLNRISIAGISWQALRQLGPRMPVLPRALAHVKALMLSLYTHEMFAADSDAGLEDCAHYLRDSGALHKFLSACPSLTHLDIAFGVVSAEAQAASLDYVFGETTWKSLCQINFSRFKLPAVEFCSFLQRHQDTLRDVVLEDMCVGRLPDTWATLLAGVRALNIRWKHFRVLDNLFQDGAEGLSLHTSIETYPLPPDYDYQRTKPDATQMIEDYVTKKTGYNPVETTGQVRGTGDTIWYTEAEAEALRMEG